MRIATHELTFNGAVLARGFWLYVWEIRTESGASLYYVGRTGDSSSTNAQSPFNRMAQHLGFAENSNMLRRHLVRHDAQPEHCSFRLVAHGPIEAESTTTTRFEHDERRNRVTAMEKALAEAMCSAGYIVMNQVKCRSFLDTERFETVLAAFAVSFPRLAHTPAETGPV